MLAKDLCRPNPKYKQAKRIADKYNLEWFAFSEKDGIYEIMIKGKDHNGIILRFTEDMLELAIKPEYLVESKIKEAQDELDKD